MAIEKAIRFGGRSKAQFEKLYREWKRLNWCKYFQYDFQTGKGRAISEEEHLMTVKSDDIHYKYLTLKETAATMKKLANVRKQWSKLKENKMKRKI